jgi:hypothetical protein
MTDRTWTGNVNNSARNPGNWDPTGAPQPGDNLLLPSGSTIDVTDDDLHGDPLVVSGAISFPPPPTTINLSHHAHVLLEKSDFSAAATVIVNVKGTDFLDAVTGTIGNDPGGAPSLTVSLAHNARLLGSFNMRFGTLTISDGNHARYVNNGTDSLRGTHAVIGTDVTGSGTFQVSAVQVSRTGAIPGFLEFGEFVSKGQTVDLTGLRVVDEFGNVFPTTSTIQLDEPKEFRGTVDLHDLSIADLVGLAKADSWSYENEMLSIFNGCGRLIDKLNVISDATSTGDTHGLSVSKSLAGDVLVNPGTDFHGLLASPTS